MSWRGIRLGLFIIAATACRGDDPLPPINGWGEIPPQLYPSDVQFNDLTMKVGHSVVFLNAQALFTHSNPVEITAASSDTTVVVVSVEDGSPAVIYNVTIMAAASGVATVTVTATDVWESLTSTRTITVTVTL